MLGKKKRRQYLDEWKKGIMSECDKFDIDDAYTLAQLQF
jgi:hypothetical protein